MSWDGSRTRRLCRAIAGIATWEPRGLEIAAHALAVASAVRLMSLFHVEHERGGDYELSQMYSSWDAVG